ncbi:MAG: rRNA maturation RNase YbeY [Phycisphaerae bacterium]
MEKSSAQTNDPPDQPPSGQNTDKARAVVRQAEASESTPPPADPDDDAGPEPGPLASSDVPDNSDSLSQTDNPLLHVAVVDTRHADESASEDETGEAQQVEEWRSLKETIRFALVQAELESADVTIALVDDEHMAALNEKHLQHTGPTDVLTFDFSEPDSPNDTTLEGEIVISVDTAKREASSRGHDWSAEVTLYAVHGILHLLGYDDHDPTEAARMHEREDAILRATGWGTIYARDDARSKDAKEDAS